MAAVHVELSNGRTVGLDAFGDPMADRLVLICHPTPGSAAFDPDPVVTNRWGVHLIGLDRPGYGGSEPLPAGVQHSLAARADEVAELLRRDEQNADRISNADLHQCGAIGWGSGGVVAAALAARHPGLIDRLVLVSPPAPAKAEDLAHRVDTRTTGRAALRIADDDPAFSRHVGLDHRLDRMLDDAGLHGPAGIIGDGALLSDRSWVGDLADMRSDVLVVIGEHDPVIDSDDLRWWREHLPVTTRFSTIGGSASLAISDGWEEILAHVAPARGRIPERERDQTGLELPDRASSERPEP